MALENFNLVADLSLSAKSIVDDRWGVEGIYSQNFSVAIFFFLMFCIVLFTVIVVKYMQTEKGKSLKTGEKVMFFFIFLGIIAAVIMAVMQLLQGYLF